MNEKAKIRGKDISGKLSINRNSDAGALSRRGFNENGLYNEDRLSAVFVK